VSLGVAGSREWERSLPGRAPSLAFIDPPTAAAGFPPAPPTDVFAQRHTRTLSLERRPPTTSGLSRWGGGGSASSVFTNPLYATFVVVVVVVIGVIIIITIIVVLPKKVSVINSFYSL